QREYPAFIQAAKAELQQDYRLQDLQSEGLRIFTTLDPWVQDAVEQAAEAHLATLEKRQPKQKGKLETAVVVTSVDGGEIRALLGGRDPDFFGFNRAVNAHRSIGSVAKPAVFLTALKSGNYHWGTRIDDAPVSVKGQDGSMWQPKNYDFENHGMVPMLDALTHSYNQSTARLGMTLGLDKVTAEFRRLGVSQPLPQYPSMLLGSTEMAPVDVARMFQTIASEGFSTPLRTIDAVTMNDGTTLSSYAIRGKQEYDPVTIQWLTYGMEQVVEQGTGKALKETLPLPIAGKTGTSDQQRDAWFVGFDQRYLGVVWVGRDDNQSMPFGGSSAALPIWKKTFEKVGVVPLLSPSSLTSLSVNEEGEVNGPKCSGQLYAFPVSWLDKPMENCDSTRAKIGKEIKSWFDWLL
ncbi:MAG: penicillin-binding transpeptidase domain-containing protein, partial [Oleibacter sp.]|nr:penicillin-binding transpeptidase domain-containing protein [Thalassolituus sp.]